MHSSIFINRRLPRIKLLEPFPPGRNRNRPVPAMSDGENDYDANGLQRSRPPALRAT